MRIKSIKAQKILDSRGNWTNKAVVELESGAKGYGEVPSGASVGKREALLVEVDQAIANIDKIIAPKLLGKDAKEQVKIDAILKDLGGGTAKSLLGANATLAVSLGVCEAEAASQEIALYRYIADTFQLALPKDTFPTPLFNIINGGAHAGGTLDFQEFMVAPATYKHFDKALEMGVKIYKQLESLFKSEDLSTEVGDEGGFAPAVLNINDACSFIVSAGQVSGFNSGSDFFIALDVAANFFSENEKYVLRENRNIKKSSDLLDFYTSLVGRYPIIYLEDPFSESDPDAWAAIVKSLGDKIDIIGDDLTVTNPDLLEQYILNKDITGVIVKPNQVGTLTETIEFVQKALKNNLVVTVSHRSGETGEDTFIADLAVAVGARYIKAGAPARGERVVKYNRLLEIFNELKGK